VEQEGREEREGGLRRLLPDLPGLPVQTVPGDAANVGVAQTFV
jgi:hypothetical protein